MDATLTKQRAREDRRDRALVRKAVHGDQRALAELYHLYSKHVFDSCRRVCRDRDDALDATQQAFLNVFERLDKLRLESSSFRDYLFVTSRNISIKMLSKSSRVELFAEVEDVPGDRTILASGDPERRVLIKDQRELVRSASNDLYERQYRALVLYEIDGLSYEAVGQELGIARNAVAQLVMRARRRLQVSLRREVALKDSQRKECRRALEVIARRPGSRMSQRPEWTKEHLRSCDLCSANTVLMDEVGASYRQAVPALVLQFMCADDALASAYALEATGGEHRESGTATSGGCHSQDSTLTAGVRVGRRNRRGLVLAVGLLLTALVGIEGTFGSCSADRVNQASDALSGTETIVTKRSGPTNIGVVEAGGNGSRPGVSDNSRDDSVAKTPRSDRGFFNTRAQRIASDRGGNRRAPAHGKSAVGTSGGSGQVVYSTGSTTAAAATRAGSGSVAVGPAPSATTVGQAMPVTAGPVTDSKATAVASATTEPEERRATPAAEVESSRAVRMPPGPRLDNRLPTP